MTQQSGNFPIGKSSFQDVPKPIGRNISFFLNANDNNLLYGMRSNGSVFKVPMSQGLLFQKLGVPLDTVGGDDIELDLVTPGLAGFIFTDLVVKNADGTLAGALDTVELNSLAATAGNRFAIADQTNLSVVTSTTKYMSLLQEIAAAGETATSLIDNNVGVDTMFFSYAVPSAVAGRTADILVYGYAIV